MVLSQSLTMQYNAGSHMRRQIADMLNSYHEAQSAMLACFCLCLLASVPVTMLF